MHKNIKLIIYFAVISFSFLFYNSIARAEQVIFQCPNIVTGPTTTYGATATITGTCTIPTDIKATKWVLSYDIDDGGDIYINNQLVFSLPDTFGTEQGISPISLPLPSSGSTISIKINAKNAWIGPEPDHYAQYVYGRATIQMIGTLASPQSFTISGYVFTDSNGNSVKDGGEPIWPGRTVELYTGPYLPPPNEPGVIVYVRSTTTDSNGNYSFSGLTGGDNWRVRHIVPSGYTRTTDDSLPIYTPLISDKTHNFGFIQLTQTPPPDITPPKISNVRIVSITQAGATVTWDTDESSDSQVEYCLTGSRCGTNTSLNANKVTSHSVNLSGLTPDTYYYIWAKSRDISGNLGILGYYLFRTLTIAPPVTPTPTPRLPTPTPIPPVSPPVISDVQMKDITYYSVTVSWDTDRPTTGAIIACTNTFYCSGAYAVDSSLTTSHSLTIDRLRPDRQYYVWIISRDVNRIRGSYTTSNFRTQPGLIISNLNANSTSSSIIVNWNTNIPASSLLIVCRFLIWCYGASIVSDLANVLSHSLSVTDLNPSTTYYFYVVSREQPLGYRVYSNSSVTTLP